MRSLLKQPLLHFLLLGALLFFFYGSQQQQSPAQVSAAAVDGTIIVDRAALLDYMQYQAKAFDTDLFSQRLDSMSAEERQSLINDYVREEALYREALKLGMEKGDYIIKQRLVQKEEFLLENSAADTISPADDQLQAYYAAHVEDYRIDPVYTFTHIFFDAEKGGMAAAKAKADKLLPTLKGKQFSDAGQYGDRFPFLQNYVERTRDFAVNNFGPEFVDALDKLTVSPAQWQGPFQSHYGYHLVMLTQRTGATTPPFDQVRPRVLDDFRYETLARKRQEAEAEVVKSYEVQVKLEPHK
ncbi:MAG TPA: peptidylprolyl isomerase [Candidatus Acidoferrum sp.]|nr:peptidylprolyl isomerase [Candidatus Acidoferrum sp.]